MKIRRGRLAFMTLTSTTIPYQPFPKPSPLPYRRPDPARLAEKRHIINHLNVDGEKSLPASKTHTVCVAEIHEFFAVCNLSDASRPFNSVEITNFIPPLFSPELCARSSPVIAADDISAEPQKKFLHGVSTTACRRIGCWLYGIQPFLLNI